VARSNLRRSVRRSKDQSGLIWTAVATEVGLGLATAGDVVSFQVVNVDADVNAALGQAHCTLLRIRGWIQIVPIEADVGVTQWQAGIAVHDDDNPNSPESWTQVNTYTQEDVLWTYGGGLFCPAVLATGYSSGWHVDVDVRSKRRLRSGKNVTFSVNTTSDGNGPDLSVTGALRALVKLT